MRFGVARDIAYSIQNVIPDLYITGSVRRKEEEIKDLDFITRRPITAIIDEMVNMGATVKNKGPRYASFSIDFLPTGNDIQTVNVDIWYAKNDYDYLFKKTMRNMDKNHYIGLVMKANKNGYHLSENGLKDNNGRYIHCRTKADIIRAINKPLYDIDCIII